MEDKRDRRVIRTEEAFKEAFLGLIKNKKEMSLTVRNLAEIAGYSRNAFYLHFESMEQFILYYIRNEAKELIKIMDWTRETIADDEMFESIRAKKDIQFFEHIYKNRQFYELLSENGIMSIGLEYICEVWVEEVMETDIPYQMEVENKKGEMDRALINYATIYQYMGMVRWWIKNHFRQTPAYMAEQKWNIRHKLKYKQEWGQN